MVRMSLLDEEVLSGVLAIISAFAIINISPEVGTFYTFGVLFYLIPLLARRKDWIVEFITKRQNILKSMGVGLIALAVWIYASSFLITYVEPSIESIVPGTAVFEALSRQTQVPILSQDPTVRLVVYGILIPIVESLFFLSFWMKFLSKKIFQLPQIRWYRVGTPQFWKMLWVCAVTGATGSLFHLTVRMASDYALLVDFLFFFCSSLLVFKFRRLTEATSFHAMVNSGILIFG